MADTLARRIKDRFRDLQTDKNPWFVIYDAVNMFVCMKTQSLKSVENQKYLETQFTPDQVFDSTASTSNFQMASSLIGSLYPNADRTFVYKPSYAVDPDLAGTTKVKEWYEGVTVTIRRFMSSPAAKFIQSLLPYMNNQGAFGTSGIVMLDNYDKDPTSPYRFRPISMSNTWIAEDMDGSVDTVYTVRWLTVRQIVQEYELGKVSSTIRDYWNASKFDEKFQILTAVEPRSDGIGSMGNDSYPIACVHMEVASEHILKNEGYHEMFIFMARFLKLDEFAYGWCPAMTALPDIFEVNSKREAEIIATDKFLDPPLLVDPERLVNNGVVNSSSGALNAKKNSGNAGENRDKPVEPMILTGELVSTIKRIGELQQTIKDAFFNDDLRQLGSDQRMTLGEAQIRDGMRANTLVQIYNQQINELFTPVLIRAFNIAIKHGLLGVVEGSQEYDAYLQKHKKPPRLMIPMEIAEMMAQGEDVYMIEYISPAGRMLRKEELLGIQQTISGVLQAAGGGATTTLDVVDWDEFVRRLVGLSGAPSELIKSVEDIAKLRDMKSQAMQAQQAAEGKAAGAHTFKVVAQGAKAATEAGIDPMQLLGGGQ